MLLSQFVGTESEVARGPGDALLLLRWMPEEFGAREFQSLKTEASVAISVSPLIFHRQIREWDHHIIDVARADAAAHPGRDNLWATLSESGSIAFLVPTLGLAFGGDTRKRAALTLAAEATTSLVIEGLKRAVGRERPNRGKGYSFPSGHAGTAFAEAFILGHLEPGLQVPLYVWASGVGVSRVGLRDHYPSDVIAGTALGLLIGNLLWTEAGGSLRR